MARKGYIIERYSAMTGAYTCNRLVEEAAKENIQLDIIGIEDCVITKKGVYTKSGEKVTPCDFTIRRYKTGITARLLSNLAPYNYNTIGEFERYNNKYLQLHDLLGDTIPLPNFLLGTNLSFAFAKNTLGLPFVMKGLESSQGAEVYLIREENDYLDATQFYPLTKEWLFQEYIKESHGQDIRAYVIRGKVIACMKRTAQQGFKANVALGAIATPLEVTPEISKIASHLYQRYQLDFFGLDLLLGAEKLIFCEVNVMAGIQGIEEATGVNVAAAIIQTIQKDLPL